jgi:hypothetical protein
MCTPGVLMTIRIILTMFLLTGCRNDCQQVCSDIADYAADECGEEFSRAEISECMSAYKKKDLSDAQLDDCKEYGSRIEEEWTCEDIGEYFE